MSRALGRELGRLVAATRGWLEELHEEGVEALAAPTAPARTTAAREPRAVASPSAPGSAQLGLVGGEPASPWGASPTLDAVREALGECTRCRLHQGRSRIVFGDGNPDADLLFVGEGPGAEEDRRGLPFVGRAGELLTSMIEKGLGIPRRDVYICNIVKCRPPENRTPLADEAATCRPFLDGQIAAVRPRVIIALGKPAASLLLGREVSITRIRGIWHDYRGIPLMPTFHPAFILRQYTQENRRAVWSDLRAALERSRQPDQ
ncbi:MAG TPA: uracil-DNA glycosylase [Myxococcota bacterium]|nr:uracil-DNA glycosylase [Myxococcota bacterium]